MTMDARMLPLRDWLSQSIGGPLLDRLDAADELLAPEGPLFPALRMIGETAVENTSGGDVCVELGDTTDPIEWLAREGIVGPLAEACLAAAEVRP